MSIVTRTGDTGMTGIFGGQRASKDSPRLHACGTVDELNALLGLTLSEPELPADLRVQLHRIQHLLFRAGADLSTPVGSPVKVHRMEALHTQELEEWITRMEGALPPQKAFILPSGSRAGSELHLARTVCRRAERFVVALQKEEGVTPEALIFLNRLSDYLFLAARHANTSAGATEEEVRYE